MTKRQNLKLLCHDLSVALVWVVFGLGSVLAFENENDFFCEKSWWFICLGSIVGTNLSHVCA